MASPTSSSTSQRYCTPPSSPPEPQHEATTQSEETLPCVCDRIDLVDCIGCDSGHCPIEWYHLECVGLTEVPDGDWICPRCARGPISGKAMEPLFPNLAGAGGWKPSTPTNGESHRTRKAVATNSVKPKRGIAIKKAGPKRGATWRGYEPLTAEQDGKYRAGIAKRNGIAVGSKPRQSKARAAARIARLEEGEEEGDEDIFVVPNIRDLKRESLDKADGIDSEEEDEEPVVLQNRRLMPASLLGATQAIEPVVREQGATSGDESEWSGISTSPTPSECE